MLHVTPATATARFPAAPAAVAARFHAALPQLPPSSASPLADERETANKHENALLGKGILGNKSLGFSRINTGSSRTFPLLQTRMNLEG
jgi:hypothetical protein